MGRSKGKRPEDISAEREALGGVKSRKNRIAQEKDEKKAEGAGAEL